MINSDKLTRLREIEERYNEATPGDWYWLLEDGKRTLMAPPANGWEGKPDQVLSGDGGLKVYPEDAQLIAMAKSDIGFLLNLVSELRHNNT